MDWFLPLAAKSFLVAGGTLLLLRLARSRSASDRSWIAHLGLAALALLTVAPLALPALEVPVAFLAEERVAAASVESESTSAPEVAETPSFQGAPVAAEAAPVDWAFWGYAAPALLLLLLTLIAVGRLVALKARAQVLVDSDWLSALARAQRRMNFKNGTALLTSEELQSPVSWGLVRPVIVLSTRAAEARDEAEAIIAHELAHVARLDWAKLLLARAVTAIFWFNPLVWLLAREAHQLREETADDAVLAADIEDTEYANLLVGIARHECRGLLLGAHGVAPARNSLARRVKRVLDGALARAPGGWRWSSAAAFFAAGMAVPVAALNFVPTTPRDALAAAEAASAQPARPNGASRAGVSSVAAAAEPALAVDSDQQIALDGDDEGTHDIAGELAHVTRDARRAASQAVDEVSDLIDASAVGVTPSYAAAIRASGPALARADVADLSAMKVHGVTPEFARELHRLGYRGIDADSIVDASVQGVTTDYARSIASAGYGGITIDDLAEMRLLGVTADFIRQVRRAGYGRLSPDALVEARLRGIPPPE